MADKAFSDDNVAIHMPLNSNEDAPPNFDDAPPPYQHPTIDFSSGWKDRGFAIAFYIHALAVIIIGLVLGIPPILSNFQPGVQKDTETTTYDETIKLFLYALGGAAAASGVVSFVTFFLLQLCAGRLVITSIIIMIITEIVTGVLLAFFVHPAACMPSLMFFCLTMIFICCIRKRIPFAEAHLRVGCAVLRSHPSLILVTVFMYILEILWLIFWCLMVVGILNASGDLIFEPENNTTTTTMIGRFRTNLGRNGTPITTTRSYMMDAQTSRYRTNTYWSNTAPYRAAGSLDHDDKKKNQPTEEKDQFKRLIAGIISFILLLSWYWGAITLANITQFITSCSVGHWWFTADAGEQYKTGTSIKRAFTTNFGTICFGSLFEGVIKAFRSSLDKKGGLLSAIARCILGLLDKIVGYMNDWAFIYSALTGQSFLQASRSFIDLFRRRGWTMIINDTLIGYCLGILNLLVGIVSAIIGGIIAYVVIRNTHMKQENIIITIVIITMISFLIGILLSTVITTLLKSCVRAVFVCYALNPAALGATHPNDLKRLTDIWHEFYPKEFAESGYNRHLLKPDSTYIA